jgi:hypothetical protein
LKPFFAERDLRTAAASQPPLKPSALGTAEKSFLEASYAWAAQHKLDILGDIPPNPFSTALVPNTQAIPVSQVVPVQADPVPQAVPVPALQAAPVTDLLTPYQAAETSLRAVVPFQTIEHTRPPSVCSDLLLEDAPVEKTLNVGTKLLAAPRHQKPGAPASQELILPDAPEAKPVPLEPTSQKIVLPDAVLAEQVPLPTPDDIELQDAPAIPEKHFQPSEPEQYRSQENIQSPVSYEAGRTKSDYSDSILPDDDSDNYVMSPCNSDKLPALGEPGSSTQNVPSYARPTQYECQYESQYEPRWQQPTYEEMRTEMNHWRATYEMEAAARKRILQEQETMQAQLNFLMQANASDASGFPSGLAASRHAPQATKASQAPHAPPA